MRFFDRVWECSYQSSRTQEVIGPCRIRFAINPKSHWNGKRESWTVTTGWASSWQAGMVQSIGWKQAGFSPATNQLLNRLNPSIQEIRKITS